MFTNLVKNLTSLTNILQLTNLVDAKTLLCQPTSQKNKRRDLLCLSDSFWQKMVQAVQRDAQNGALGFLCLRCGCQKFGTLEIVALSVRQHFLFRSIIRLTTIHLKESMGQIETQSMRTNVTKVSLHSMSQGKVIHALLNHKLMREKGKTWTLRIKTSPLRKPCELKKTQTYWCATQWNGHRYINTSTHPTHGTVWRTNTFNAFFNAEMFKKHKLFHRSKACRKCASYVYNKLCQVL